MVQPEQPQLQRLPLFFRLRTARTANTRIHAKIKMSSTVPIFFPFGESGNHRRMRPAPSAGSRASGMRQSFQGWPRCFAPLLRSAPPCGALRASGLRSGFAAVLTPRCFAPLLRPAPPCGALRASDCGSPFRAVLVLGASHPYFGSPCFASRASGLRSGFAAVLTPRCFAPLLRPAPPCGRCGLRTVVALSGLSSSSTLRALCCGPCHRYFKPFCFSSLRGAEPYRHSANLQG